MLQDDIIGLIQQYYNEQVKPAFVAGETYISPHGAVHDAEEMKALTRVALKYWLTEGAECRELETLLAHYNNLRHISLVNSGSSANLLALASLSSRQLGSKALRQGAEIITPAVGFPTTVNAIIQQGYVPVFVDVVIPFYNANIVLVEEAVSPKTGAIMMAHTLGNPFNLERVERLRDDNGLYLINDCCDALGSTYDEKPVSGFGDLTTFSFYPAHHITTGEGGAVGTNSPMLNKLVESFRDWGRDCWCATGRNDTCGKRFSWQMGTLPYGYDHKYVYSHLGYNLKMTDMGASVGRAQMSKLPEFVWKRRDNWAYYRHELEEFSEFLIMPEAQPRSNPSWFGFALTVREGAPFTRRDLVTYLEAHKVGTRMMFGGNLLRHPAYEGIQHRIISPLKQADIVTERTFWIGVWPGITMDMRKYVVSVFADFFKKVTNGTV